MATNRTNECGLEQGTQIAEWWYEVPVEPHPSYRNDEHGTWYRMVEHDNSPIDNGCPDLRDLLQPYHDDGWVLYADADDLPDLARDMGCHVDDIGIDPTTDDLLDRIPYRWETRPLYLLYAERDGEIIPVALDTRRVIVDSDGQAVDYAPPE